MDARIELELIVEEWACDHPDLVRVPHLFAEYLVDYAYDALLGGNDEEE